MKKIICDKERIGVWVAERVGHATWGEYQALGVEQEGELIAGVVFDGYVKNGRCSMHCAGIGKRWLSREFLRVIFEYAFGQLGCKVILIPVPSDNDDSLHFNKHLGFEEVVRIEGGYGNADLVLLALPKDKCRWLNLKAAHNDPFDLPLEYGVSVAGGGDMLDVPDMRMLAAMPA